MAVIFNDDRFQIVPSKYANCMIAFRPSADEDVYYVYRKTKTTILHDGTKSESYRCRGCERAKGGIGYVSTTFVKDGRLVRDPDPDHRDGCVPFTKVELEAKKLRQEMVRRCKAGDEPMIAYDVVMAESQTVFEDQESQRLLREKVGTYARYKSNLMKHTSDKKTEAYKRLSTRERRRLAAVCSAEKRKAARDARMRYSEDLAQDNSDEASAAVQWLSPAIVPIQCIRNNRQPNVTAILDAAPDVLHCEYREDDHMNYSEHDYMATPVRLMDRTKSTIPKNRPTFSDNGGRRMGPISQKSPIDQPEQQSSMVNAASMVDIVKVVEACRKRSRWESFGEYIAKTLESMPEEHACEAAKEVQEILFRAQGASR